LSDWTRHFEQTETPLPEGGNGADIWDFFTLICDSKLLSFKRIALYLGIFAGFSLKTFYYLKKKEKFLKKNVKKPRIRM
jgi:hypothetical protein